MEEIWEYQGECFVKAWPCLEVYLNLAWCKKIASPKTYLQIQTKPWKKFLFFHMIAIFLRTPFLLHIESVKKTKIVEMKNKTKEINRRPHFKACTQL